MQFKNNSSVARAGFFMRWAEVNADNSTVNNLNSTALSARCYRPATNEISYIPYGLLLQNSGVATISHSEYALNSNQPPDACEPSVQRQHNANGYGWLDHDAICVWRTGEKSNCHDEFEMHGVLSLLPGRRCYERSGGRRAGALLEALQVGDQGFQIVVG